jgi:RNA polymerase sigma-70 factor (ECF subfamily)
MTPVNISSPINNLYRDNQFWLRGWLYSRVKCSETAADLAQDTFLRLLKTGKLPPAGESRRFLTHIAKGLMIDAYRRQKIEEAYLESLRLMPETSIPGPEIHHVIIETLTEIAAVLDNLSDNVRLALLLRQIEGLSYADIGKQLSVSISSVEKYIAQGLVAFSLALESN